MDFLIIGKLLNLERPKIVNVAANKTLQSTDSAKILKVTAAATLTIPNNAVVPIPKGAEIVIIAYTANDVAIAPDAGVTLNSKDGNRKIDGQFAGATLKKIDVNEWLLIGALKA